MNRLQELRLRKGISIRRLAQDCGMSHTQISRIEHGEQTLSASNAAMFGRYFGVSADYLLGASPEEMYSNFVSSYEKCFLEFGVDKDGCVYGGYRNLSPEMGVKIGILRYLEDINEIGDLSKIFELVAALHKKTF